MKIVIRKTGCAGHARCAAVAPEVYELNDDGYIAFTNKDLPPELEAKARRGAMACPERIIAIQTDK